MKSLGLENYAFVLDISPHNFKQGLCLLNQERAKLEAKPPSSDDIVEVLSGRVPSSREPKAAKAAKLAPTAQATATDQKVQRLLSAVKNSGKPKKVAPKKTAQHVATCGLIR
jgi:hypothetical protein